VGNLTDRVSLGLRKLTGQFNKPDGRLGKPPLTCEENGRQL
jgi:hypothetical protein